MSGIYVHIPFCRRRCVYCDFYSTARHTLRDRYIDALCAEAATRRDYLRDPVQTVYIGGGTPSLLSADQLERLFRGLDDTFDISHATEITLEANPDDLTADRLHALATQLPINRLSIGVQTFHDERLRRLGRRHTAADARRAVGLCHGAGIDNLSIDLIYGLPGETMADWQSDLAEALSLDVAHISAYHLTYEEGTPLSRMLRRGQVNPIDEELSLSMLDTLIDTLTAAGYRHYEISNFCRPGHHSRHNSAYWDGTPYIGLGAAAHSYDGRSREWNIASLTDYIDGMARGRRPHEREELTPDMRYNERLMTGLRTRRGVDLDRLQADFGIDRTNYCLRMARTYIDTECLTHADHRLSLTRKGLFISDAIIANLLYVEG